LLFVHSLETFATELQCNALKVEGAACNTRFSGDVLRTSLMKPLIQKACSSSTCSLLQRIALPWRDRKFGS
jgi:hypothetical protein